MPFDYDLLFKPIQVLAVAISTSGDSSYPSTWLHGYALLTIQPRRHDVDVGGAIVLGRRYVDDALMVTSLENALDSEAVLAGKDLTNIVHQLGQLGVDAADQRPALALLDKIETMLGAHSPIDVAIDFNSRMAVSLKVIEHKLPARHAFTKPMDANELQCSGSADSLNPSYLAAELADTVSAAALAIGEIYLEPQQNEQLIAAWQQWRQDLQGRLQAKPAAIEPDPID